MDLNLEKYRILVTGASGVLGLRLSEQLLKHGAQVIGLDLDGMNIPFQSLAKQYSAAQIVTGNMLDVSVVEKAVSKLHDSSADKLAVFHFAAMSDANQCDRAPKDAFQQNVVSTINLLEVCSKKSVKRIVYPSTAYVYGSRHAESISEDCTLNPGGIYPLTKLLAEEAIKGYSNFNGLSCDNVRISNIYGPTSKPNTILGTIMLQAKTKDSIFLHDLRPVRDFIYIEDVIEALMGILLAGDEQGCRTYNLSTGIGTSVGELAQIFCQATGLSPEVIKCDNSSRRESVLVLSNQKLVQRIGWEPRYTVLEGIKKILSELKEIKYVET